MERNIQTFSKKNWSFSMSTNVRRMHMMCTDARTNVNNLAFGKKTYDSKGNLYHGVEVDCHSKRSKTRFRERKTMHKQKR